ncbi:MAG: DUF418 domain-containing protein [Actinomycetota bacterium]
MTAQTTTAGPTTSADRITNLDAVRGIAVLGILLMNGVAFGLGTGPYYNLDTGGSSTPLDWAIGGFGEIFVDQKFMALFSMLFGAGIVLFADRAEAKGLRAGRLSLWRNFLLFVIGIVHSTIWIGDVLVLYAVCAPVLILVRRRPPAQLFALGGLILLISPIAAVVAQGEVEVATDLAGYWTADDSTTGLVDAFMITDAVARALSMMLIGVALHRTGVITGQRSRTFYRRLTAIGLGVGLPLATLGFAIMAASDFDVDVALVGTIPNTLGTVPVALGYLGLITLWNQRGETARHRRVHAVGRMALTNYLSQTVIGVLVLDLALDSVDMTRTIVLAVIIAIWALQLWWSQAWLERYRYGPAEWAWRCATYRRTTPLRR